MPVRRNQRQRPGELLHLDVKSSPALSASVIASPALVSCKRGDGIRLLPCGDRRRHQARLRRSAPRRAALSHHRLPDPRAALVQGARACGDAPMICSSVNRLGFMSTPSEATDSTHSGRRSRGSRHRRKSGRRQTCGEPGKAKIGQLLQVTEFFAILCLTQSMQRPSLGWTLAATLAAVTGLFSGFHDARADPVTHSNRPNVVLSALAGEVVAVDSAFASGWSSMLARHTATRSSAYWRSTVGTARQLPLIERLWRINRIVNSANYAADAELWGKADYWATPGELFRRGGDCEDFATAKFLMLRDAGVSSSQMFVLVLHAGLGGAAHAVLIVETEDGPMVLDNLRNRIYPLRGRMARRTAFAINDQTMWVPLAWAKSSSLPKPAQDDRLSAQ